MSRTVQNTIDWAAPYVGFLPLNIGTNNEPAMSNANIIQQTVLSPPFAWAWNRNYKTFSTVTGVQDYTVSMTDFGYLEKATTTQSAKYVELTVCDVLAPDSRLGRPDFIAYQLDDNVGNITFRLSKVPDGVYTVTLVYQKKVPLLANLTDTWAIPDEYEYVFDYGFLALALAQADDPRQQIYNQKFVSSLLGLNRGLSDIDRNIFVGAWMNLMRQETNEQLKTQQGVQARSV